MFSAVFHHPSAVYFTITVLHRGSVLTGEQQVKITLAKKCTWHEYLNPISQPVNQLLNFFTYRSFQTECWYLLCSQQDRFYLNK